MKTIRNNTVFVSWGFFLVLVDTKRLQYITDFLLKQCRQGNVQSQGFRPQKLFVVSGTNGICSAVVSLKMSLYIQDSSSIYLKRKIKWKHLTHLEVSNVSRGQSGDAEKHCCRSLECLPALEAALRTSCYATLSQWIPLLLCFLCLPGLDLLHQADCGWLWLTVAATAATLPAPSLRYTSAAVILPEGP